jgi:hypothetical protein
MGRVAIILSITLTCIAAFNSLAVVGETSSTQPQESDHIQVERGINGFERIKDLRTGKVTIKMNGEVVEPIVDPIIPCDCDGANSEYSNPIVEKVMKSLIPDERVSYFTDCFGSVPPDTILTCYWNPHAGECALDSTMVLGPFSYSRFEAYVDTLLINTESEFSSFCTFLSQADERLQQMEDMTGWSSERWFGVKLEVFFFGHDAACYGGYASPTHSTVSFSDPLWKSGCQKPYYEDGEVHYNNPGELGDNWKYMSVFLHEALHSINPYPIYTRTWLTEGWSEYYNYNVLVPFGDINQETADTYLENGSTNYQWACYIANDYHDCTIDERELQRSHGYDITGWMMCKMRDEQGLDWDWFYQILNRNRRSLDKTFSLGPPYIYYTDAFVLKVFGMAMGQSW